MGFLSDFFLGVTSGLHSRFLFGLSSPLSFGLLFSFSPFLRTSFSSISDLLSFAFGPLSLSILVFSSDFLLIEPHSFGFWTSFPLLPLLFFGLLSRRTLMSFLWDLLLTALPLELCSPFPCSTFLATPRLIPILSSAPYAITLIYVGCLLAARRRFSRSVAII